MFKKKLDRCYSCGEKISKLYDPSPDNQNRCESCTQLVCLSMYNPFSKHPESISVYRIRQKMLQYMGNIKEKKEEIHTI